MSRLLKGIPLAPNIRSEIATGRANVTEAESGSATSRGDGSALSDTMFRNVLIAKAIDSKLLSIDLG